MKRVQMVRRNLFKMVLVGALSPVFALGCGGGLGELALAVVVIKVVAVGALAILSVAGSYWLVESARLDAAKKELILQGMKEGQHASSTIQLTDDQLKTIEEKGRIEIQFEDGKKVELEVEH